MAVPYKLVKRVNPIDFEGPRKYHAIVDSRVVSFDQLAQEIAEGCTLTSADVKAVLDRANIMLDRHLSVGNSVKFGEFGTFRLSIKSAGADQRADFKPSMIRGSHILFVPGSTLRATLSSISYTRSTDSTTTTTTTASASAV